MTLFLPVTRGVTLSAALWLVWAAAQAQVARVFVSINGSDGNVCSNVATPCRSFSGGITQAQPIVVNAGVTDAVTIRGLTSKALTPGTGIGIIFSGGKLLTIENCVINGWQTGVEENFSAQLFVRSSIFRNNQYGIQVESGSGTAYASIEHSRFEASGNFGVFVGNRGQVGIRECVASGNFDGFFVGPDSGTTADLTVENSLIVNNSFLSVGSGGVAGGIGTVRVSNCTVTGNLYGLYQESTGVTLSRGNNTVRNNGTDSVGTIGSYSPN
jgi:hypothetical protein